jgi:hypothetical protein
MRRVREILRLKHECGATDRTTARPMLDRRAIALIWLVQRPLLSFQAALRRTRRIPPAARPGYLMGIRLERYIAEGLRKLGCGGA